MPVRYIRAILQAKNHAILVATIYGGASLVAPIFSPHLLAPAHAEPLKKHQNAREKHDDLLYAGHSGKKLMELGLKSYQAGKYASALNEYRRATQSKDLSAEEMTHALVGTAGSAYQNGEYKTALAFYKRAEDALDKRDDAFSAAVQCGMGEVLYELERYDDCAPYFEKSIDACKRGKADAEILLRSLEGLAASFYKQKQYAKALPIYREVAYIDRERYGKESAPYGWTLRVLSDIYSLMGDKALYEPTFNRSVWIFRQNNYERLLEHWTKRLAQENSVANSGTGSGAGPNTSKTMTRPQLEAALKNCCFGSLGFIPDVDNLQPAAYTGIKKYSPDILVAPERKTLEITPWSFPRIAVHEPASFIWADPRRDVEGLVVCVPGFGLHRRSFADLGEALSQRGYVVFSYDVRGFGAYTALKARDRIDLEKSLDDLDDSIIALRHSFEKKPVFLLGESMGGSIALQFCARHPDLVEGLIAAVPSEERYSQWLTSSKVALGLLTGSRKLIDVSTVVVKRATSDKDLRASWREDPDSRMTATARELVGFKHFLSRNHVLARQVKDTPVLMYQGVHDLLIRPEGTIKLFKEIANDDKNLVLIGKSEHLVFEEGQFKVTLLESLLDWMKNHSEPISRDPIKTNEKEKEKQDVSK